MAEQQAVFEECFEAIDQALLANRSDDAIQALSSLVASCGSELKLARFEDFDRYMTTSEETFKL